MSPEDLRAWAQRHGVSHAALAELRALHGAGDNPPLVSGVSESAVQSQVRLEASRLGLRIWRNNVGAMQDESGRVVRYGLGNDSHAVNKMLKSADLIGIRPILITDRHLGTTLGQFVSREIKPGGWRYTGTPREVAQLAWATLITSYGGDAAFATGQGTL
jgi:hypothetical protein